MSTTEPTRGLRVLSLDGGGIRGLSEVIILHEIMARLRTDPNQEIPRPCDYFDLICGTSTGGLIAIMLGRLGMSTDQARDEYIKLGKTVFSKKKWFTQDGNFKATKLEKAIKEVVQKYGVGGNSEELMLDQRADGICKTAVCVQRALNMTHSTLFRTYKIDGSNDYSDNVTIWQAARATSAAPTFFKRIYIGPKGAKEEFLDGGLGSNNPVSKLIDEADEAFPELKQRFPNLKPRFDCILSIGTGKRPITGLKKPDAFQKMLPKALIDVLASMATDTEETAERVLRQFEAVEGGPNVYFRLNVEHGMQEITLAEWERLGEITTHTKTYLDGREVRRKVDGAVAVLRKGHGTPISYIPPAVAAKRLVHWNVPHSSSPTFTGREEILQKMEKSFGVSPETNFETLQSRRSCVLYGLGGAGKTQICLKFCEKHRERFWGVFWIDMTSMDTAEASFRDIAGALGVAEKSSTAVKQHLSTCDDNCQWLLIIDNADDPKLDISQYLPSGDRGTLIITTRNPDLRVYAADRDATHEVGDLSEDEAVKLLLKAASMDPETSDEALREDADKIVRELGFLALAIDQAGSYIANRRYNLKRYLADFKMNRGRLLEERISVQKSSMYQWTAYTTWNMSFDAIKDENPLASAILLHFSFLHYEKIPIQLFQRASDYLSDRDPRDEISPAANSLLKPILESLLERNRTERGNRTAWDDYQFEKAIATLCSFSLVKRDMVDNESVYSTHPLVHSWTRERLLGEQHQVKISAASLLGYSIASTDRHLENDYAFRSRLFVHVDSCLRLFPELMEYQDKYHEIIEYFALLYNEVGSYNTAARLFEGVLEARKRLLGREHPDTLISMNNLALTYGNQGKSNEAEVLQVEVLETQKRVLGPDDPDTFTSMNNLASTYGGQGKWNEAEVLQVEVLETQKRVLGPDHPHTFRSMSNLASTYRDQGKSNEAEVLQLEVLEAWKRLLGPEHPDTLTSMSNLASTYTDQGKSNEAEVLQAEVLETQKRVLGPDHPSTLTSMSNLASTYRVQGKSNEAEVLQVEVLEARKRVLGPEHPDTLTSMDNLASIYGDQGKSNEAEVLEVKVLEARKRLLGPEHPDTLTSMDNLASIYGDQGKSNEAEVLEVKVLEARKRLLGPEHPDTLTSMNNLAWTYWSQGKWNEAEVLQVEVLEAWKRLLGPDHPDTLTSMSNLALTYRDQGKSNEAEVLQAEVLETQKRVLGPDHPSTLTSMSNLASTYWNQGKSNEAEVLQVEVLETQKRVLGPDHPSTLTGMNNLAHTYESLGRMDEALELMVSLIPMRTKVLGDSHPDTLAATSYLHRLLQETESRGP